MLSIGLCCVNMTLKSVSIFVILIFECLHAPEALLVVPEDVGTAFAAIYGFSPRIIIGRDHRFGLGFRFGNHADFQVLYELGPQTTTGSLQRATSSRVRSLRRRPFLELLVRVGAGALLATPAAPAGPPPRLSPVPVADDRDQQSDTHVTSG